MSLDQVENLLQKSPLDRETKLQIVDLLIYADDETMVNNLIHFLIEWKRTDDEAVKTLTQKIEELTSKRTEDEASITRRGERKTREIADTIGREKKIQQIRNAIINSL